MFDLQFFTSLFSIFIVNIILSGDNAVVIALASRKLPSHQQKKAILWGTAGAVVLLITFTFIAAWLLKIPFLHFAGGLILMWIAYKLLNDDHDGGENIKASTSLGKAIQTVIVADLVMSFDNVLAIAGISGENVLLIILGLGFSVPVVIWGSTLLMKLMEKFPIIIWVGAGLLCWTAGEMINKGDFTKQYLHPYVASFDWIVPLIITIGVLTVSFIVKRRKKNPEEYEEDSEDSKESKNMQKVEG